MSKTTPSGWRNKGYCPMFQGDWYTTLSDDQFEREINLGCGLSSDYENLKKNFHQKLKTNPHCLMIM